MMVLSNVLPSLFRSNTKRQRRRSDAVPAVASGLSFPSHYSYRVVFPVSEEVKQLVQAGCALLSNSSFCDGNMKGRQGRETALCVISSLVSLARRGHVFTKRTGGGSPCAAGLDSHPVEPTVPPNQEPDSGAATLAGELPSEDGDDLKLRTSP